MSGIFGFYYRNQQKLYPETLNKMGESMAHRGLDGIDIWFKENIGIGNCMFHTTPESVSKKQPIIDNEKGLIISADARIDARDVLAKKLGLFNRLRDGISDSELILAAYVKWEGSCVDHLIGDFSFLIWDQKRQQLFCARDHLGIKPFYYHVSEHVFVAASEDRAILKVPEVPKTVNEGRIADFLVYQLEGIDKTSTFYESISRLPPAHTLLITREKISIDRYWELDPETEIRYESDDDYVEAFHEIFKESVNDRLRCNGQVTSMLSGGVDSSYIVGTARQLKQESNEAPLITYSGVDVENQNCRETHFINSILSQGGLNSVKFSIDDLKTYQNELFLPEGTCEDLFDKWMTMQRLFYCTARDRGQRVMLDGVDGDAVHSLSVSYPAELFRNGLYRKAVSESFGIWRNSFGRQEPLHNVLKMTLRSAFIPDSLRNLKRSVFRKSILANKLHSSVINPDFSREINIEARLKILDSYSRSDGSLMSLRQKQIQTITHPYLTVALERYDRVAADCSIEPRHPMLDKRLVEFSISLPWDQKVRHGWSKYILRRASESILPNEVSWRQGWESISWMFTNKLIQENMQFMVRKIAEQESEISRYIDPEMLEYIAETEGIDMSSENGDLIWNIFHMTNWLKFNV